MTVTKCVKTWSPAHENTEHAHTFPDKNVQRSKRADKEGVDQKKHTLPVHKKNKIPEAFKKQK